MANAGKATGLTFPSLKKKNSTFSLPFEVDKKFRAQASKMRVRSNELLTSILCDYLCIPSSEYGIIQQTTVHMPPGDDDQGQDGESDQGDSYGVTVGETASPE